jgi:hypothetical protein
MIRPPITIPRNLVSITSVLPTIRPEPPLVDPGHMSVVRLIGSCVTLRRQGYPSHFLRAAPTTPRRPVPSSSRLEGSGVWEETSILRPSALRNGNVGSRDTTLTSNVWKPSKASKEWPAVTSARMLWTSVKTGLEALETPAKDGHPTGAHRRVCTVKSTEKSVFPLASVVNVTGTGVDVPEALRKMADVDKGVLSEERLNEKLSARPIA